MKTEQPVLGVPGQVSEEKIESLKKEQADRKIKVMDQLDDIKEPIMATVLIGPEAFEYRNRGFWLSFQKRDKTVRNMLAEFLNSKKIKK